MTGSAVLGRHGQPVGVGVNYHRNVDKAFENLLGMLVGMASDGDLTDGEIVFLNSWLKEQFYLRNDPDVVDLLDAIDSIVEDGVITQEEREDLMALVQDIVNNRDEYVYYTDDLAESIKRSLGVITGMSADSDLTDQEVLFLRDWIMRHGQLKHHWPFSVVFKAINDALADGFISYAEKVVILATLEDAVGGSIKEDGVASGKSTRLPVDRNAEIRFDGKVFCFTGLMSYGTRSECVAIVERLGGKAIKNVTKELDYLVIGGVASRDWFNTSYGRKIEKAVEYKLHHNPSLMIVDQEMWISSFD